MSFKVIVDKILSSDLNKKIISHSFWVLAGNILSKSILLIATIFMTRYLGKEEYGQFGIIKSTILMFAIFAGMELGITSTKYISQYRDTNKEKIERIVGLSNLFAVLVSIFFTSLVYIFSKEIALKINAPNLYQEIRISSFILFFSSLNGIQNGILAGLERFKEISINNTIAGVVSSLALIFCSKYYDLYGVVIAFGSNFVLLYILNLITLKKCFYSKFRINIFSKLNFIEFNVIKKFSLPAILAGLMVGPVTWFCNYLLVNQLDGYKEMASFDIANQWRNTILFIPSALSQIVLPMLSSNLNNKENYKIVFDKNLKMNIYIGVSFSLIFIIVSPIIIWIYGEIYSDAKIPMIIMFLTTALITVNNVIGQGIASQGKMWLGFFVNIFWAIVLLFSSFLLVEYYKLGAVGLSVSYLVSYIFHTAVQYYCLKKML